MKHLVTISMIVGLLALVAVLALLFPASQQFTSRQKRQLARLLGTEKAPVTSTPEQYGDVFHAYLFLKQMEGWGLVKVRPGEELAQLHYFQVASAVILGLLALVLRLPLLLVPVLAVVGYLLPQQLANNAWSRMRSKVDEQLLTLVGEMAATVNFTTDPVEILRRAEVSLRGAGQEFLADELQRTLAGLVSPEIVPLFRDGDAIMRLMCARSVVCLMVMPDQRPVPPGDSRLRLSLIHISEPTRPY